MRRYAVIYVDDTLYADLIAELKADNGVVIDGVTLKDGGAVLTVAGGLQIGAKVPIKDVQVTITDNGLTDAHLGAATEDIEYVFVGESVDAVIALCSQNEGGHGSGIDLLEVNAGTLADRWTLVRESSGSGSDMAMYYGTDNYYPNNTRCFSLSTVGTLIVPGGLSAAPGSAFNVNAANGDTTITGDILVSGAGPHAIDGALSSVYGLTLGGVAFVSSGASTVAAGVAVRPTITGAAGDTDWLALLAMGAGPGGTIATQTATESIGDVSTLRLGEPNITNNLTGGGVITNAQTLLITGAPTEGAANWALRVASGATSLVALSATTGTFSGVILGPDGAVGAPSYSFSNATNYGMWYDPATGGWLKFSRAGVMVMNLNNGGAQIFGTNTTCSLSAIGTSAVTSGVVSRLQMTGYDDAGTPALNTYAAIEGHIDDNTAGSEDGHMELKVSVAGTSTTMATVDADGIDTTGHYEVDGTQVLSNQGAAVADATDAASAITQLNALLARCRTHGLIAT